MNLPRVRLGVDVLFDTRLELVRGKRVGLLTNPSGVDSGGRATLARLWQHPDITLAALFGPEHGLDAVIGDALPVEDGAHTGTGLPVYSLYGPTLHPTRAMLAGLDAMVCDIQDVGVRFYTYVWTLAYVLEACGAAGLPVIVLDRPNPIGGERLEGATLAPGFESFVGRYPVLLRHGLTIGEVARLVNNRFNPTPAALTVIPSDGWRRAMWWDDTGLGWIAPSPALRRVQATIVYPGTCFIEGTNLSEGRGTDAPFEMLGAPWIDGAAFTAALNAMKLPGVVFEACAFTPTESKGAGRRCEGVRLHVTDRAVFWPVTAGVALLDVARRLWPHDFAWLEPASPGEAYHIDRLAGSAALREAVDAGVPAEEIVAGWEADRLSFARERRPYLLYH